MLSRRKIPATLLILFVFFCILGTAVAKKHKHKHKKHKHKHHHDDDWDDDDRDDDDRDDDYWDKHDDDDDDNNWSKPDDDDDDWHKPDDDDDKVEKEKPEFETPKNEDWLDGIDFSIVEGRVRPVGSGICEDAKCDGTDNDECFETCGNTATPDDIYGCPAAKTWALTFDDGPSNFTTALLDALDQTHVKVTFCVMGAHAKQYPEIIKRAYEAGHQIASHTYSHPHLMSLTNEEIVYEVRATEEAIKQAIGVKPTYIRPPYGEADGRVKAILKQMGYKTLMWNVDPTDYNVHMLKDGAQRIQKTFDKIASGTPSLLNAHNDPGFISLQHDLYKTSIDQVPKVIANLQSKGYKFMTAAECIGDKEPHLKMVLDTPPATEIKQQDATIKQDSAIKQDSTDNSGDSHIKTDEQQVASTESSASTYSILSTFALLAVLSALLLIN